MLLSVCPSSSVPSSMNVSVALVGLLLEVLAGLPDLLVQVLQRSSVAPARTPPACRPWTPRRRPGLIVRALDRSLPPASSPPLDSSLRRSWTPRRRLAHRRPWTRRAGTPTAGVVVALGSRPRSSSRWIGVGMVVSAFVLRLRFAVGHGLVLPRWRARLRCPAMFAYVNGTVVEEAARRGADLRPRAHRGRRRLRDDRAAPRRRPGRDPPPGPAGPIGGRPGPAPARPRRPPPGRRGDGGRQPGYSLGCAAGDLHVGSGNGRSVRGGQRDHDDRGGARAHALPAGQPTWSPCPGPATSAARWPGSRPPHTPRTCWPWPRPGATARARRYSPTPPASCAKAAAPTCSWPSTAGW